MSFPIDPTLFDYAEDPNASQTQVNVYGGTSRYQFDPNQFDYTEPEINVNSFDLSDPGGLEQKDPMRPEGFAMGIAEGLLSPGIALANLISGKKTTVPEMIQQSIIEPQHAAYRVGQKLLQGLGVENKVLPEQAPNYIPQLQKIEEEFQHYPWYAKVPTELVADLPMLFGGAKVAGLLTKGIKTGSSKALKKITTDMIRRGSRGAAFSVLYDFMKQEQISPQRAALFAGIDIGFGFGADFIKTMSKLKKARITAKDSKTLNNIMEEGTETGAVAKKIVKDDFMIDMEGVSGEIKPLVAQVKTVKKVKDIYRKAPEPLNIAEKSTDPYSVENVAERIFEIRKLAPESKLHFQHKIKQVERVLNGESIKKATDDEIVFALEQVGKEVAEGGSGITKNTVMYSKITPKVKGKPSPNKTMHAKEAEESLSINFDKHAKDAEELLLENFSKSLEANPDLYTSENIARQLFLNRGKSPSNIKHFKAKTSQVDRMLKGVPNEAKTETEIKNTISSIFEAQGLSSDVQQAVGALNEAVTLAARKWKTPLSPSIVTPGDMYAHAMGSYDIVKGGIEARRDMEVVFQQAIKWLKTMGKDIERVEGASMLRPGSKKVAHEKFWTLLDQHPDAKSAGLTGKAAETFTKLRDFTQKMLDNVNAVRVEAGLDPIEKLSSYMHHMFNVQGKKALRLKHAKSNDMLFWVGKTEAKTMPKQLYNPTEFARKGEFDKWLIKDPVTSLSRMAAYDLRQVYMTQPNIMFTELMKKQGKFIPQQHRTWLEHYWKEAVMGGRTKTDDWFINAYDRLESTKLLGHLFKGIASDKGGIGFLQNMRKMLHLGTIPFKPLLVVRNRLQLGLTHGLVGTKAFSKGMMPSTQQMKDLIKETGFYKSSQGHYLAGTPAGMFNKVSRAGFYPYGRMHLSNVYRSMKSGYHATEEWIVKKRYAKFGWADPKRTYTEPKGFLYPSEKIKVINEMEHVANASQYWYNTMGMGGMYRSEIGKTAGSLQSWAMNYTTKYWREMVHRVVHGTSYANPGAFYPPKARAAMLRHAGLSALVLAAAQGEGNIDLRKTVGFGVLPTGVNPILQAPINLTQAITSLWSGNEQGAKNAMKQFKRSAGTFIPYGGAYRDVAKTLRSDEPFGLDYFFYTND